MAIRRLIICFDGTWNTPDAGPQPTNVVKLLRAVRPLDDQGTTQIAFYDKGVGTGDFLDKIAGGASGAGLTENVIDGYRFLGNNYAKDDEIYIFGFSRGAYTARSLAGLVGLAGILKPIHLGRDLSAVMEIYRSELKRSEKLNAIEGLKLQRYVDTPIRCVGVWDTVGSLGIPGDLGRQLYLKPYHFHDVELSPAVDVALHAVAIDEKRSAFAPTLWVSGDGKPARQDQVVEQVWFPGVHSNIGGSYKDAGLSDVTLNWMVKRVRRHTDLALDDHYLRANCAPRIDGIGYESRSLLYLTSRVYEYQRLINQTLPAGTGFGEWFRKQFRDWDRRNIIPEGLHTVNEMLHVASLQRWELPEVLHDAKNERSRKQPYRPENLAAIIRARSVPVVNDEGDVIPKEQVSWPTQG